MDRVLPWLPVVAWAGIVLRAVGAWALHAWRSPAYRPSALIQDEDTVPIPLDPVDQHATTTPIAATTPIVSACLCDPPGCGTRPCRTYEKEHAYR